MSKGARNTLGYAGSAFKVFQGLPLPACPKTLGKVYFLAPQNLLDNSFTPALVCQQSPAWLHS